MNTPVTITAIWLRKRSMNAVEVLVEIDGVWRIAITENPDAPFSHIAEGNGVDHWRKNDL